MEGTAIDPGGDFDMLKQAIEEQGFKIAKVLLTHGHVDHASAAGTMAEHYGVKIEGPHRDDQFLINAHGLLYDEVCASNLIKIDIEGNILSKPDFGALNYGINKAGYVIHSAVHSARHDVACVIHTHTRAGMAVSAMKCGLIPLTQTGIRFVDHLAYHDYEGPAIDLAERERLVHDLGEHNAMILNNHGLLTCGPSCGEAFNLMYNLELACRAQVDAMASGTELRHPSKDVLAKTAHLYQPGARRPYGVLEWHAMLRLLKAESSTSGFAPYWA